MLSVTCSPRPFAVLFLLFTSIAIAGCGGGGSSGSAPVSGGSATDTTATSVIGDDCTSYYRKLWIDDVMKKAAYPSA